MRIGILVSHPIQYYSPLFRALAPQIDLHVYYAHRPRPEEQGEGFGEAFQWDVDLLSGYEHTFLRNVARDRGTHYYRGCDTPEIRGLIALQSFDAFIVFGWFLKSYWQAIRACQRSRIPVLVRGDSTLRTARSPLRRVAKELTHRFALRQFDGFLSVGRRNREYLLHYGVPAERIFFAPHFVDNEWFSQRAAVGHAGRSALRQQWGARDKTFVALFAGKFIPEKRISDLLEAGVIARRDGKDVVLVLVGAGALGSELRALTVRLHARVCFEGFKNQSELARYYGAADVIVLPSQSETWGLVVNEGMACGLPAIVSEAVGCAPDLIEEGKTGFTFPVGNIDALAAVLGCCADIRSPAMSAAVLEKISLYSIDAAATGVLDALGAIARKTVS